MEHNIDNFHLPIPLARLLFLKENYKKAYMKSQTEFDISYFLLQTGKLLDRFVCMVYPRKELQSNIKLTVKETSLIQSGGVRRD